jgi:hypothetical protein
MYAARPAAAATAPSRTSWAIFIELNSGPHIERKWSGPGTLPQEAPPSRRLMRPLSHRR